MAPISLRCARIVAPLIRVVAVLVVLIVLAVLLIRTLLIILGILTVSALLAHATIILLGIVVVVLAARIAVVPGKVAFAVTILTVTVPTIPVFATARLSLGSWVIWSAAPVLRL